MHLLRRSLDVRTFSPLERPQPLDLEKARFERARDWLKHCNDNHPKCQALHAWKSSGRRYQPQRLVRIPEPGSTTWRLVLRGEYETVGDQGYVTLSHRWTTDPDQNKLLLDENMGSFRRGQDVAVLPRTFQDALVVARELNVPYIWIDCLCIIQNSAADWDEQSREMGKIYTHSICNISPTGVANNSASFLEQIGRVLPLPTRVRPAWLTRNIADQHESPYGRPLETQDDWCVVDRFSWWAQVTKKPLMKRGWVFQERLLTQRVLHFGADQLLWECATHDACEAFPHGLPPWLHTRGQTNFKDVVAFQSALGHSYDSVSTANPSPSTSKSMESDTFYSWCDIIESYSRTRLTKSTDKLVALAGIAEFASRWRWSDEIQAPPRYHAGVFSHGLLLMLEWNAFASRRRSSWETRPAEFVAPTWSWASINDRVYFDYQSRTFSTWHSDSRFVPDWATRLRGQRWKGRLPLPIQLLGWEPLVFNLRAQTKTSPEAPFSRVYDGHLDAEGWILKLRSLFPDRRAPAESEHDWPVLIYEDAPAVVPKDELFALPLRCIKLRSRRVEKFYWVTGLVLRKTEAADEATYTRFGLFSIPSSVGTRGIGVEVAEDPFRATISNGGPLSAIRII